jgi:hypothetical protein
MSKSENPFSRWSRLKHEATVDQRAEPVLPSQLSYVTNTTNGDEGQIANAPLGAADLSTAPVFDPASLPPIESITALSDIRPFLQACVPAELRQAALRSAWAADPAIRDFIGIAENQWDFNDPAGIPGFGVVKLEDYAQRLASLTLENLSDAVEDAAMTTGNGDQSLYGITAATPGGSTDKIDQVAAVPTGVPSDAVPTDRVTEEITIEPGDLMDTPLENRHPQNNRVHGGALPK